MQLRSQEVEYAMTKHEDKQLTAIWKSAFIGLASSQRNYQQLPRSFTVRVSKHADMVRSAASCCFIYSWLPESRSAARGPSLCIEAGKLRTPPSSKHWGKFATRRHCCEFRRRAFFKSLMATTGHLLSWSRIPQQRSGNGRPSIQHDC